MSSSVSNFTVESILHSLKEVQREKLCLEQKLNEQRNKRRNAEKENDCVHMKFIQLNDIHNKMTETLKVAQMKVNQTQAQADSLEDINTKRRGKIADINRRIENETENQHTEVQRFEEELSEFAAKLISARNNHKDDYLDHKIQEIKEKKMDLKRQSMFEDRIVDIMLHFPTGNYLKLEIDGMDQELEALTLQPNSQIDYPEIGVDLRRLLWVMLKDEADRSSTYLDLLQTQVYKLKEQLEQYLTAP